MSRFEWFKHVKPNADLALNIIRFVFGYVKRVDTRNKNVVALLSFLSFFLQSSLALTLIFSSRVINGEPIGIFGLFTIHIDDKAIAVLAAVFSITTIMSLYALVVYLMNVQLRKLARKIHTYSLYDLLRNLASSSYLQTITPAFFNRLMYQATLHLGITAETMFGLIQPILMVGSALLALIVLDPLILLILAISVLPVLPVYIYESQKLVNLSESFHGKSAGEFPLVFNSYINLVTTQNFLDGRQFLDKCSEDERFSNYLDDYDSIVLANDKMMFIFAVYRPILFAVVLVYLTILTLNSEEVGLIFIPILFGVYYLSNGAIGLIANLTNLVRFMPQLKILKLAMEEKGNNIDWKMPGQRTAPLQKGELYPCHFEIKLSRSILDSLGGAPIFVSCDVARVVYLAPNFTSEDVTAEQLLTVGNPESWHEVGEILERLGYHDLVDKLPDGRESRMISTLYSDLTGRECGLFHLVPLIMAAKGNVVILDNDILKRYEDDVVDLVLGYFTDSIIFVNCQTGIADKIKKESGIAFTEDFSIDNLPMNEFIDYLEKRQHKSAKDNTIVVQGSEMMV